MLAAAKNLCNDLHRTFPVRGKSSLSQADEDVVDEDLEDEDLIDSNKADEAEDRQCPRPSPTKRGSVNTKLSVDKKNYKKQKEHYAQK